MATGNANLVQAAPAGKNDDGTYSPASDSTGLTDIDLDDYEKVVGARVREKADPWPKAGMSTAKGHVILKNGEVWKQKSRA
jgi:hypothetical protein